MEDIFIAIVVGDDVAEEHSAHKVPVFDLLTCWGMAMPNANDPTRMIAAIPTAQLATATKATKHQSRPPPRDAPRNTFISGGSHGAVNPTSGKTRHGRMIGCAPNIPRRQGA